MRIGVAILVCGLVACSEDEPLLAPSVPVDASPMVACSIELPASDFRDGLLGDWESEGLVMYRVRSESDGVVVLEQMTGEDAASEWRFESKNPRWVDGRLVIEQFAYAINIPSHPFSGQRMVVYFQPTDDPDLLLHGVVSVEFADELPAELAEPMELKRASPE